MPRQHVENTKDFWSENEAKRAHKHASKRIIYWPPFWNKVYTNFSLVYWDLLPRDRRDEQGGAPIATYPLGSRSQFCRGRKPECPEETLEVRLRSTETRSTYNIVVEVEGVIDVHYASLTSQGVQHRVFYRDGHPSRFQPRPTGLNFGEQTGTGVFPLVIAASPLKTITAKRGNRISRS